MSNETEKPIPAKKRNWRNIGILSATFAIIVLLGIMIAISYRAIAINIQLANLIHSNQTEVDQLKIAFNNLQTDTKTATTRANTFSEKLNLLQKNIDELSQSEQDKKNKLIREEANYYIKLAQFNLVYTTNIPQALHLLELADQAFATLSGADVTTIRSALATDIARLQSTPIVDVDGIYARLSVMYGEIKQLHLINQPSFLEEKSQATSSPALSWWRAGLQNTWAGLKQLVIVRHTEQNQLVFLPNVRTILYQNLNACVTNAIWALLHGEQDIYLGSLNQMSDYLTQYFIADDVMTKAMQIQITNLKNLYIRQSAPTLSVVSLMGTS